MLRPSIVLARNPNRDGHLWPARLCDRDEVEESFAHSDLNAEAQVGGGGHPHPIFFGFFGVFFRCYAPLLYFFLAFPSCTFSCVRECGWSVEPREFLWL